MSKSEVPKLVQKVSTKDTLFRRTGLAGHDNLV